MKFVLADKPRYWWPVTVRVPDPENPGKVLEQTLKLLFEPRDQDAEKAEQERILKIENQAEALREERASLAAVIKGWDDVVSEDKSAIAFTPESIELALKQTWFRAAVWEAYYESQSGEEARLGN